MCGLVNICICDFCIGIMYVLYQIFILIIGQISLFRMLNKTRSNDPCISWNVIFLNGFNNIITVFIDLLLNMVLVQLNIFIVWP